MSIKRKEQLTDKHLLILESEMPLCRKDMGHAYTLWLIGGSLGLLMHHFYLDNVEKALLHTHRRKEVLPDGIR